MLYNCSTLEKEHPQITMAFMPMMNANKLLTTTVDVTGKKTSLRRKENYNLLAPDKRKYIINWIWILVSWGKVSYLTHRTTDSDSLHGLASSLRYFYNSLGLVWTYLWLACQSPEKVHVSSFLSDNCMKGCCGNFLLSSDAKNASSSFFLW